MNLRKSSIAYNNETLVCIYRPFLLQKNPSHSKQY